MSETKPPDLEPDFAALLEAERGGAPGPDEAAMERMYGRLAAALPLAGVATAASTAEAMTTATAATSGVSGGSGVAASSGAAAVTSAATKGALGLKGWLLASALTVAGGGGVWWAVEAGDQGITEDASPAAPARNIAPKPDLTPSTAPRPTIPVEPAPAEVEPPALDPSAASGATPEIRTPPAETSQATAPPKRAAPRPPSEARLLKRAIQALKAGQSQRALRHLARHRRLYPDGIQSEERERLSIRALVELGRLDEARRRFDRFRGAHPRALHLDRLQRLIESAEAR